MMSNTPLATEWDVYLVVLREDAHQLLAWSYADTQSKLAKAKDEYEMTGLLSDAMDARINALQTPERFTYYSVHNEKLISPSGELGKKRPRLDIQIQLNGMRPKPCFTFEAKRLRDDTSLTVRDTMRQYLGDDGIRRFVTGRYAQENIEAAMLGCIQAHDAEFWFDQVSDEFDSDISNGSPIFALVIPLRHANVIVDFPDERVSVHARVSGGSIQIFHLFIDCRLKQIK